MHDNGGSGSEFVVQLVAIMSCATLVMLCLFTNECVLWLQTDEFFLFASLMTLSTVVFAIMSYHYKYVNEDTPRHVQQLFAAT